MFKLEYLNVERVVESEHARDTLINKGYKLVEDEKQPSDSELYECTDLSKLTVDQLKELANDRGMKYDSKILKADLTELLAE